MQRMIRRIALLSVHTSPLAPMGGKKTGGMNVYIRELAQEFGARGIAVDIFTRRTSPDEPMIDDRIGDNVRVIYLSIDALGVNSPNDLFPYLPQFTARLMAFATRNNLKYDMIYSHYWLSGWVAQKLNESWGVPFVQMFHTLGQMKQRILTHETIMPDQRIRTEMEITQWAARIVAATPAEHSQLQWLYRANRRKIEIVPPGVNTQRFVPDAAHSVRHQLGMADNEQMLLFVGRIEPLKAVDNVLHALDVVRDRDAVLVKRLRFVIVGGDPADHTDSEMLRLQTMVHDLGLEDHVIFAGAKDQNELPAYYAAATAVLMPSEYESFGMVALEAMASGTPVIASNVGGLAYLVRDEETGFLVPVREPQSLAKGIQRLLSDQHTRQRMGQRASLIAQEYAWPKIADRLLAIFDNVLAKRSPASA